MHVTPGDLRPVRRDGLVLRVAHLGGPTYVVVDAPEASAPGAGIETDCAREHWGYVVRGEVEVLSADGPLAVSEGSAFHVPAGVVHAIAARPGTRVASFVPNPDEAVVRAGTMGAPPEPATIDDRPSFTSGRPTVFGSRRAGDVEPRRITAEGRRMGAYVFSRVRLGPRSGYTAGVCDLPHWGLVVEGRLTVEWEDDVAALAAGDLYHCPPGPPGHRLLAVDPAVLVDYTPVDAYARELRTPEWRATMARTILSSPAPDVDPGFAVEVAQLA